MTEIQNNKTYDLEERTYQFAKNIVVFSKKLPKTVSNIVLVIRILDFDYYLKFGICYLEFIKL